MFTSRSVNCNSNYHYSLLRCVLPSNSLAHTIGGPVSLLSLLVAVSTNDDLAAQPPQDYYSFNTCNFVFLSNRWVLLLGISTVAACASRSRTLFSFCRRSLHTR